NVTIEGNNRTSDHVIRRELFTLPGQKFSRSALMRTHQQLSQLGYFDPEQIGMNPEPNMNDGTVDIHYSVVERPSDQLELSGGWGGFMGFVGTLGVTFNNFSARKIHKFKQWSPLPQGDGQRLSLRLQANGRQFQTYSFSFSEPWLGGKKPNNFTISLQHSVQRRWMDWRNLRGPATGSLSISGATIALGRRLRIPDDYFNLSNSISFQQYGLDNFPAQFRGISDGRFNSIVFNTTIARRSVDSPIYPRNGSELTLSLSLTPPYSAFVNRYQTGSWENLEASDRFKWVEYHKWMFDNSWFMTIVGDLVLNARTHFGFLGAYQGGREVSPFERFMLGGSGMMFGNFLLGTDVVGLRGYRDNSIVPPQGPQTEEVDNNPLMGGGLFGGMATGMNQEGGVIFSKYVLELRYPLTLNQAASLYVLAFAEAGNNWGSVQNFHPLDLRRSVGVGARIFMPAFGLLGIDYGYGFDAIPGNPNANGGQFHFTIGQMIR
ncbi:MAG: BamA/TamA family outer membrane protein, partial [Bernardetiaceae bacterium]|nr:BamA/TamA family outer membrane protein [Bernardetiaceae bacterium]